MPTSAAPVFISGQFVVAAARTFSTSSQPSAPAWSVISAPAAS
jgi:hypothetical protein